MQESLNTLISLQKTILETFLSGLIVKILVLLTLKTKAGQNIEFKINRLAISMQIS